MRFVAACFQLFKKMSNSILRYLKEYPSNDHLPNPKGSLSTSIPSSAIASANKQVRAVLEKSNKRGKYNKYSDKERAKIGKFTFSKIGKFTFSFTLFSFLPLLFVLSNSFSLLFLFLFLLLFFLFLM